MNRQGEKIKIGGTKESAKERGCIYKITAPSGRAYIGQSRRVKDRLMEHSRSHLKHKRYKCHALAAAIEKYGWDSMTVEILEDGLTEGELNDREIKLIKEHDTLKPNGYNIMAGGSICPWDNPDTADHLRKIHKTEDYVQKQRNSWNDTRRAKMKKSNQDRNAKDGLKRIREIAAYARSLKTDETNLKMAETHRAKAEASRKELEKTNPKLAAQKRRKAEMDRARHARILAAQKSRALK